MSDRISPIDSRYAWSVYVDKVCEGYKAEVMEHVIDAWTEENEEEFHNLLLDLDEGRISTEEAETRLEDLTES